MPKHIGRESHHPIYRHNGKNNSSRNIHDATWHIAIDAMHIHGQYNILTTREHTHNSCHSLNDDMTILYNYSKP